MGKRLGQHAAISAVTDATQFAVSPDGDALEKATGAQIKDVMRSVLPMPAARPRLDVIGPANFLSAGLGNLRVGLNSGTDYVSAFVFTAEHSAIPASIRVDTPNDGGGYSGGTGGTIRARIFPVGADDQPAVTSPAISTGTYVAGLTSGAGGNRYPTITLTGTQPLVRGALYAVVFDNTDTTNNNFSSVNCSINPAAGGPCGARAKEWAAQALVGSRTGGINAFPSSWERRSVTPASGLFYGPMYSLVYATGASQGDIRMESTPFIAARTYVATNAAPIRERVSLTEGRMVSAVIVSCAAVVGGDCTVDLLAADGTTVLATATISQAVADDATDAGAQHLPSRVVPLPKAIFLAASTVYFVRFTPQSSATFRFSTSSNGSRVEYGAWTGAASWTQSKTQVFTGAAWRDAYVYDFAATGYGDTFLNGFGLE